MISEEKLNRINYLAKKKKEEGLTDDEAREQKILREEYLENFRKSFRRQLDDIELVD